VVFVGEPLNNAAIGVPLVHLRFLVPVSFEPLPDEREHVSPSQLVHFGMVSCKVFIPVSSYRDQTNAYCVRTMDARSVDVRRCRVDLVVRQASDCGKHAVYVLAFFLRPWLIQSARLIGPHLCDDDVDLFARQRQAMLVIVYNVVGIVEVALGTKGKSDGQKIGVGSLAAAPFQMNDEVLDLKKAVQAEIPIGHLFRG
jgi:hypothetical protein